MMGKVKEILKRSNLQNMNDDLVILVFLILEGRV